MPTHVRSQIVRLLNDKRHRKEYLAALTLLALAVTLGVASVLTQQGHAATQEVQVLDCPVTGTVAHAHDESCYDGDGNLVCPLPEVEAHVHDDSCYAEERVLVCGLEEGEGHVHTDGCYEVVRTLVCGKDEVTETHVHGPGCFRTVDVEVPDEGPAGDGTAQSPGHEATPAAGEDLSETHPKQSFSHEFKDADGNLVLRVEVEAPEGALPAGSRMVATWVDPESLSQKQQDAVDAAIAKKADGQVLGSQAVDIAFVDASGAEVEPAKKVTVTMTSGLIDTDDQALVVHIDDLTEAQKEAQEQAIKDGKTAEEAEPARTAEALEALSDQALERRDVALADDQLAFDSDKFSTYVLAVTSLRKVMQASDGATVTVTVDAPAEAGIPQGAELRVREVAQGSADWQGYEAQALGAIGAEEAELARFFDIAIVGEDGAEIQPAEPVSVEIELADAPEGADASVVHFGDTPEVVPATEEAGVATFDASGFSVWGVVYTVDFEYSVNGKQYMFSMNGEDAISLRALLTALHVYEAGEKDHKENTDNKETIVVQSSELNAERLTKEQETRINQFMKSIVSVEFSNPDLLVVVKTEEDTTLGRLCFENRINQPFTYTEKQDVVLDRYSAKYLAGDWVLISLKPFSTKEELKIVMDTGETLSIRVTDAANAPYMEDGVTVQTIANPGGTTFDVFDYWVYDSLKDAVGRGAWPGYNSGWGAHADTEGGDPQYGNATGWNLNGSGNFYGINSSNTSDSVLDAADLTEYYRTHPGGDGVYDGHALKFSPAWEGTVYNGTQTGTHVYYTENGQGGYNRSEVSESWRHLNSNGNTGLNNYTGNGNPMQGIVQNKLGDNGYPTLTDSSVMGTNGESLEYLFNADYEHPGKQSYGNVDHLLYVDPDGYYTYDSRDYAARLGGDGNFAVTTQTETGSARGFWPFGTSKFWFGLHMKTQFSMPQNGEVLNPAGELKPMQFEFSGDDDTWIYVDGVLVGDGGGIHNRTEIDINFKDGTARVTSMHNEGQHEGNFDEIRYLDDIFEAAGKFDRNNPGDGWIPVGQVGQGVTHYTFAPGTYHYFDFFYLERGGDESNLYIHYNLVSTDDFTAHKSYYNTDSEIARLERDQFRFELIGLDGKYRSVRNEESGQSELILDSEQGAAQIQAIMPNDSGIDDYSYTLSNGATVNAKILEKGVSEEGNVNFGSALISEEDKAECNDGNAPVYRYIIREIIPNDAVNADGVTWAAADDAQKAAGGFVKDNVLYDNNVYYMAARVTKWAATDSSGNVITDSQGNIIYQYGLEKTYYTDDTFTQTRPEEAFINFNNRKVQPKGNVEFTKVKENGEVLQGAKFALYRDENCTQPLTLVDETTSQRYEVQAYSDVNGKVSFSSIPVGTYYMKEIYVPAPYVVDGTVYKVVIEDVADSGRQSRITINGDSTQSAVTQIVNSKEGQISVLKKWLDRRGNEVDGDPANPVKVRLKRKKTEPKKLQETKVTIQHSVNDNGNQQGNAVTRTVGGNTVVIEWDDEWQDSFSWNLHVGASQYNGSGSGSTIVIADGITLEKIGDGNGTVPGTRSRRLTIANPNGDVSFSTVYETSWLHSDSNHWNYLNSPDIQGIYDDYVTEDDNDFNINNSYVVTLNNSNSWLSTWTVGGTTTSHEGYDLPAINEYGQHYLYYVAELDGTEKEIEIGDSPIEDYYLSGYSANNNTGISNQGVIMVYNRAEGADAINVIIKKTDNADNSTNYLEGAVFKLMYRSDSSGTFTNVSKESVPELNSESKFTVPKDGITLTGLVDGQYQLQEISPPSGYVITNSTPVTFTVSGGAITSTQGTITGVRYTAASETSDATFIVPNEPGTALPNAGGPGTWLFTILGSSLILGAGVLLWRRQRLI